MGNTLINKILLKNYSGDLPTFTEQYFFFSPTSFLPPLPPFSLLWKILRSAKFYLIIRGTAPPASLPPFLSSPAHLPDTNEKNLFGENTKRRNG
jgi:hypothetical protein